MRLLLVCLCVALAFSQSSYAQIFLNDDFSDGDLTQAPQWWGHTDRFTVNDQLQLQLNDLSPESNNTAFLSSPLPGLAHPDDTLTWTYWLQLDFAPSPSNYARLWLLADQADLSLAQNGWYVQVGGISGNADALTLVRMENGTPATVLQGSAGAVGTNPVLVRLRVYRLPSGLWILQADYSGQYNFQTEAQNTDTFWPSAGYTGLWCRYTATRAQRFFFDDLSFGPFQLDTQPPQLQSVEVIQSNHLYLRYSEPVHAQSAAQPEHFTLTPPQPLVAESWRDSTHWQNVHLLLSPSLQSGQTYVLASPGVTDLAGNPADGSVQVLWYQTAQPQPLDVVITEIMADPTPAHGLPPSEYVELYNRSDKVYQLNGWQLQANNTSATLPAYYLLPSQYLILAPNSYAHQWAAYGSTLPLPNFPTLANSGATLQLRDDQGQVLFLVHYLPQWHSEGKETGGWSLEMRRLNALCRLDDNWGSSLALIGGTPGQPNSLADTLADTTAPKLLWVEIDRLVPEQVTLRFDEALTLPDTSLFQLRLSAKGEPWPLHELASLPNRPEAIQLLLQQALPPQQTATLTIEAGLTDCMGNSQLQATTIPLRSPQAPVDGARLNELLYEAAAQSAEFVELYHTGTQPIDPADLALAFIQDDGDSTVIPLPSHRLWWPQSYLVVSAQARQLRTYYNLPDTAFVVEAPLPPLPNDGATLVLLARQDGQWQPIESIQWSAEWHDPLLRYTRGISLERINPLWPPTADNWHSAAATVGYATPTSVNSQYRPAPATTTATELSPCRLLSPIVSPDGDGYEDVLLIACTLEQTPAAARLLIFDATGRPVYRHSQLEWLGTHNIIQWDARTDAGTRAPRGLYAIYIELIQDNGTIIRQRLGAAVW